MSLGSAQAGSRAAVLILSIFLLPSVAAAQHGGSRAGLEQRGSGAVELPQLDPRVAQSHIAIDARVEIRVPPTEVRMTLAVTGEGESAQACRKVVGEKIGKLSAAWQEAGIAKESIVVDFIAILPRYDWVIEKRGDVEVGVEKTAGFRMQSNLHVALPNEAIVDQALDLAFEHGITDIIAFDYWSKELDAVKTKACEQALEEAAAKSNALLKIFAEKRPPIINIQENTQVVFPESLYQSFVNSVQDSVTPAPRRDLSFIRAHRPQNTYYRGLQSGADRQPAELAMKPEISVVSTVRIYYESPGVKNLKVDDSK